MSGDIEAAVEMLARLADVPSEERMDTLALVVKVYIESGNHWSSLAHVWGKIEQARSGAKGV